MNLENNKALGLLALVPRIGFILIFSILGTAYAGFWLSVNYGFGNWILFLCVFLGFLSGLYFAFKQSLKFLNYDKTKKRNKD